MASRERIIVIGLDSADYDLIVRWADEGYLPVLHGLLNHACWGKVTNLKGFEAGSAWHSFATGFGPDFHAQYDGWFKFNSRTYSKEQLSYDEMPCKTIWKAASDAGKRVCLIDFPYVLLEDNLNGIQVADWYSHVRTMPQGLATTPPELAANITEEFGTNPFEHDDPCPTNYFDISCAEAVTDFRDRLIKRVRLKTEFTERLLQENDWDLSIAVFHEAHDVGHICWHVHDPEHELHNGAIAAEVGDPVLDVYRALDESIGRLLNVVGDDTTAIIYCSHGMGTERTGSNFLTDILEMIERAYDGPAPHTKVDRLRQVYRALIPNFFRDQINSSAVAKKVYVDNERDRIKSRPFFELAPNQATGGVRFNIKGREGHGVISPGPQLQELRKRLVADLLSIENLDTGRPLIDEVLFTDDLYTGPKRDALPDVLLEWNKSGPIRRVRSPLFGSLVNKRPRPRTGDHINKEGTYFAFGRGIAPGHVDRKVDVRDFAPTIAELLGVDFAATGGSAIPEIVVAAKSRLSPATREHLAADSGVG